MHATTTLSAKELKALWNQFAKDETLPDRYELTEHGELVMSPKPTNRHQLICAEVAFQLRAQLGGKAVSEAAVLTRSAGVRVPDVVWMPLERWAAVIKENGLIDAPELVVEVLSPGNRRAEIAYKVRAYLESGIHEVIVIGQKGKVEFHRSDGAHHSSSRPIELTIPSEFFG